MDDNEFLLQDRIQKIRQIIGKYGEEQFYLSFSGGKDSTVLSRLLDLAIPDNQIPRVHFNTGIEFKMIEEFCQEKAKEDQRFLIINSGVPIKKMLEEEGYPFKSKEHSKRVKEYQIKKHFTRITYNYVNRLEHFSSGWGCPKILMYQFSPDFPLKISDLCCTRLKKDIGKMERRKW